MSVRAKPVQLPSHNLKKMRETDIAGRTVLRHRTVDSLGKMLRSGAVTKAMHDAGRAFQRDFQSAGLDPLRARPMDMPPGGGVHRTSPTGSWHGRLQVLNLSQCGRAASTCLSWWAILRRRCATRGRLPLKAPRVAGSKPCCMYRRSDRRPTPCGPRSLLTIELAGLTHPKNPAQRECGVLGDNLRDHKGRTGLVRKVAFV